MPDPTIEPGAATAPFNLATAPPEALNLAQESSVGSVDVNSGSPDAMDRAAVPPPVTDPTKVVPEGQTHDKTDQKGQLEQLPKPNPNRPPTAEDLKQRREAMIKAGYKPGVDDELYKEYLAELDRLKVDEKNLKAEKFKRADVIEGANVHEDPYFSIEGNVDEAIADRLEEIWGIYSRLDANDPNKGEIWEHLRQIYPQIHARRDVIRDKRRARGESKYNDKDDMRMIQSVEELIVAQSVLDMHEDKLLAAYGKVLKDGGKLPTGKIPTAGQVEIILREKVPGLGDEIKGLVNDWKDVLKHLKKEHDPEVIIGWFRKAGAIGGAPVGAAVGSLMFGPGGGTAAGALFGSLLGAGVGAAAGETTLFITGIEGEQIKIDFHTEDAEERVLTTYIHQSRLMNLSTEELQRMFFGGKDKDEIEHIGLEQIRLHTFARAGLPLGENPNDTDDRRIWLERNRDPGDNTVGGFGPIKLYAAEQRFYKALLEQRQAANPNEKVISPADRFRLRQKAKELALNQEAKFFADRKEQELNRRVAERHKSSEQNLLDAAERETRGTKVLRTDIVAKRDAKKQEVRAASERQQLLSDKKAELDQIQGGLHGTKEHPAGAQAAVDAAKAKRRKLTERYQTEDPATNKTYIQQKTEDLSKAEDAVLRLQNAAAKARDELTQLNRDLQSLSADYEAKTTRGSTATDEVKSEAGRQLTAKRKEIEDKTQAIQQIEKIDLANAEKTRGKIEKEIDQINGHDGLISQADNEIVAAEAVVTQLTNRQKEILTQYFGWNGSGDLPKAEEIIRILGQSVNKHEDLNEQLTKLEGKLDKAGESEYIHEKPTAENDKRRIQYLLAALVGHTSDSDPIIFEKAENSISAFAVQGHFNEGVTSVTSANPADELAWATEIFGERAMTHSSEYREAAKALVNKATLAEAAIDYLTLDIPPNPNFQELHDAKTPDERKAALEKLYPTVVKNRLSFEGQERAGFYRFMVGRIREQVLEQSISRPESTGIRETGVYLTARDGTRVGVEPPEKKEGRVVDSQKMSITTTDGVHVEIAVLKPESVGGPNRLEVRVNGRITHDLWNKLDRDSNAPSVKLPLLFKGILYDNAGNKKDERDLTFGNLVSYRESADDGVGVDNILNNWSSLGDLQGEFGLTMGQLLVSMNPGEITKYFGKFKDMTHGIVGSGTTENVKIINIGNDIMVELVGGTSVPLREFEKSFEEIFRRTNNITNPDVPLTLDQRKEMQSLLDYFYTEVGFQAMDAFQK